MRNEYIFSIFISAMAVILILGCANSPTREAASQSPCSRQAEFDAKLKQMEPVIDSMVSGVNQTVPQSVSCTKQKYSRGGYELVVFIKPDTTVGGSAQKPRAFEIEPSACLKEAASFLTQFGNLSGLKTVTAYQNRFPELYSDMEIGPVKWLNCSKEKNSKYFDGWATWVHEIVHDLREQNCLFNPSPDGKPLCFDMPSDLPERSVAQISKMPTKNSNVAAFLNSVQNTYLHGSAEPPIMLFDEVNGYTQTLGAMTLILKNIGPSGLYSNGDRNMILLPLFLVYTLNYLDYIQKSDAKYFKKLFGKGSLNQISLRQLLASAELAYKDWKKTNICKVCTNNDFEDNLWQEYLKRKKSFL